MHKIIILLAVCLTVGCTENVRTKKFGGKSTITLPPGQKLVNVTFKDANLWYLTRPMGTNENPEVFSFVEKSNFGVMEGKITFIESK